MIKIECNAIIFDVDATLVDTTACIENIWRKWAMKHNFNIQEVLKVVHGRTILETIQAVAPKLVSDKNISEVENLALEEMKNVKAIPGAKSILEKIPINSWTIATSGPKQLATTNLKRAGLPIPENMIAAENIVHGKPDPEPFIKAAKLLGVEPEQCVVFEDSLSGTKAAYSAGVTIIALLTTHSRKQLCKYTNYFINDFRDIDLIINKSSNSKLKISINRI